MYNPLLDMRAVSTAGFKKTIFFFFPDECVLASVENSFLLKTFYILMFPVIF